MSTFADFMTRLFGQPQHHGAAAAAVVMAAAPVALRVPVLAVGDAPTPPALPAAPAPPAPPAEPAPLAQVATTAAIGVATAPLPLVNGLAAALLAAAPQADPGKWLAPLHDALAAQGITTPRRISAFLGQCAVEAGPGFAEIVENLDYTHATRILAVFPSEFPDLASAQECVGSPERLANRAYAGKLGNGNEASGDGWRFCGRGLIQLTGRDEYTAFGLTHGLAPDAASALLETPEGAAASAAWYWSTHGLNAFADEWDLLSITRRINGSAMEGHAERVAASLRALATFTASTGA